MERIKENIVIYILSVKTPKPVVAVAFTYYTSSEIAALHIPVVANRKDSLEAWININAY